MKTALTIAGSDSSGGAGIQADIKTMTANGVFAMSAITALTAQNTTGVTAIFDTTPQFLAQQLDAVFTDIYPDAVKIGMVSSAPAHRHYCRAAALLRRKAHCGGPRDGGHLRCKAAAGRCRAGADRKAAAAGRGAYPQTSRRLRSCPA